MILGAVSAATIAGLLVISFAAIDRLDRVGTLQKEGFYARLAMSNQESAYKELLITEHLANAFSRFEDAAVRLEEALPAFLSDKYLPIALKGAGDDVVGAIPILTDALERSRSNAEAMKVAIQDNFGDQMEGIQGLYREMTLKKSMAAFAGYAAAISGYTSIQGLVADNLILVVDYLDRIVVARERSTSFALLFGVGAAVAAGLGLYLLFFTRSLRRELAAFRSYSFAVAEGDLASDPDLSGSDEFAELGRYLKKAVADIRAVIQALKDTAADSESRNVAVKESFGTVATNVDGIGTQVKILDERFDHIRRSVSASSAAIEEVSRNISALAQLMRKQKELILESSSSTEEIGRSIDAINAMTRARGEKAVALAAIATDGRRNAQSANERIQGIHSLVSDVKGISDIIAKIASRSNLLAMNA
ncbi:MAG: methyl-accepting chemotaxis protein, partial [Spirochaetaceae bacterium]|nr:methyl-accepting chemotaxis protein [Spirochaetaceae bacterium]